MILGLSAGIQKNLAGHQTLATRGVHAFSSAPSNVNINKYAELRACGVSQGLNRACGLVAVRGSINGRSTRGARHVVYALFEKFTERSIKSVMLAQEWARNSGDTEVMFSLLTLNRTNFPIRVCSSI